MGEKKNKEKLSKIRVPERDYRKHLTLTQKRRDLENKKIQICERLRTGWSDRKILDWLQDDFKVTEQTARNWLKKAYNFLSEGTSVFKEDLRSKQQERFEFILSEAIKAGKWDVANRILDNINKMFNLYDTSQKIEVIGDTIHFKFGNVQGSEEENKDVRDADIIEEVPDNQ